MQLHTPCELGFHAVLEAKPAVISHIAPSSNEDLHNPAGEVLMQHLCQGPVVFRLTRFWKETLMLPTSLILPGVLTMSVASVRYNCRRCGEGSATELAQQAQTQAAVGQVGCLLEFDLSSSALQTVPAGV